MPYNPTTHHRRSIRLKGYDYSQAGMYFVTICCQDKICRFGKIENEAMVLNDFGKIAYDEWVKLQERYPNVLLDIFQIMPNHIHGIIVLNDVGATLAVALNDDAVAQNKGAGASPAPTNVLNDVANDNGAGASPAPTVGNIVGGYKSLVVNRCLEICKSQNDYMGKLWQRNYWEHIIRNEHSYQHIADYIFNNPINWDNDTLYSANI